MAHKTMKPASGDSRDGLKGGAVFNDTALQNTAAQPKQPSFGDACREQTRSRHVHVGEIGAFADDNEARS